MRRLLVFLLALPALGLGPMVGDVGPDSAVLWARAPGPGVVAFELDPPDARVPELAVSAESDFTASVTVRGLRPDRGYVLRARVAGDAPTEARFRTAPLPDAAKPVRLAWGGDLAGQNVCRDAAEGFPVFRALSEYAPDLFIGLGDMIYADAVCEAKGRFGNAQVPGGFGPAADLAAYRAHWRYSREDAAFAAFLARTAYVAIWDDHEVVNDFGPLHDTRKQAPYTPGRHLLPLGLRAFLEYNPIALDPARTRGRLYRTLRWGRHLELFVLDTRQYRDSNLLADAGPAKSLLGREQRAWLERELAESDATWKVVVSSVPLGIPTGFPSTHGRDGWAGVDQPTGFARERDAILARLRELGLMRTLWLTTDVHFAQVFVHHPFEEAPGFEVIEAVSGPLNAGVGGAHPTDPALRSEVRFVHAPEDPAALQTWEEARGWFNFGGVEIDAAGMLTLRVIDANGKRLWAESFALAGKPD